MFVNARFLTQRVTGVQRYATEISKRLKELRPDMRFIAPHNIVHRQLAEELSAEVIGKRTGYYWEQVELPSYLRKYHPGSVLLNLANMAPILHRNKVVTIHDVAPLRYPQWFSKRFAYTYKLLLPLVARTSKRIVSDSDFSRREIGQMFDISEKMIEVVPCATSHEFGHTNKSGADMPEEPFILSVASLDPRKNFERLVRAFAQLGLPDIRLVIVGAESPVFSRKSLRNSIRSTSDIIFTGPIDDSQLSTLYSSARLFIYPSLYEGFGLPPLEAMACGCPCVVSNTASLPEVCGDAVVYCDPYDVDDIAFKIEKVLSDGELRDTLVKKGRERAKEFSWDKSARVLLRILQESEYQ